MQQIISELEKLGLNPYYRYPQRLYISGYIGWRHTSLIEAYGIKIKCSQKPIEI